MLNKKTRKYVLYFCLLMNIGAVAGCGSGKDENNSVKQAVSSKNPEAFKSAKDTIPTEPENSASVEDELSIASDMKELQIYCITDDASDKESVISMIPKDTKVTAEVVVNSVVIEFGNHGLEIGIDSVTEKDGTVIVSFLSGKAPAAGCGSSVEGLILDCISQSLLDNLDSCKKVIFRVEGKAYESGHFAFGIDEAYDWK